MPNIILLIWGLAGILAVFLCGKCYPFQHIRHKILREGMRHEHKKKAEKFCGEWKCVAIQSGNEFKNQADLTMPVLVLENNNGSTRFCIQAHGIDEFFVGQKVLVRLRKPGEETFICWVEYSDLLKAEPIHK